MLLRGLQRGLAHAGRARGLVGEEEEIAVETVARIASDLILAGQGRDVLAIYAQAAPKSDDGGEESGKKSALVRALERLPGMVSVPERSQPELGDHVKATEAHGELVRPTDSQSVAHLNRPFFTHQAPLLPADLEPSPVAAASRTGDLARGPDVRAARPPGRVPPTPGVPAPPSSIPGNTKTFEKKSPAPAGAE